MKQLFYCYSIFTPHKMYKKYKALPFIDFIYISIYGNERYWVHFIYYKVHL